jgi:dephospho-CoA kinase
MKIGIICGNIGSGKSSVAEELRKMGYPVINTDALVKVIYNSNPSVYGTVTAIWGPDAIDPLGSLSQEVRDLALKDETVYDFLMNLVQYPLRSALGKIFCNFTFDRMYNDMTIFIESAVMCKWMYEWVNPERVIDHVFRITVPNVDERLDRVVSRYAIRNNIQTERFGFSALPQEEYDKNKLLLDNFRKMVALTDDMQNNLYNKWLGANDPHFPAPIVFANEGREDVKRIAKRIVEIVSK